MFQFSGFPSIHYGFMYGSQVLHLRGFPIRKSADRSLFAAPRSLSQLVTSFFGSWCQGIHLMLFLAWTSSFFKFSKNCWISFLILRFFCLSLANNWLGLYLLSLKRPFYYFRLVWRFVVFCYPINGKTLFLNHCWSGIFRFHKIFLNYLFVSYFTFIRFSMNILLFVRYQSVSWFITAIRSTVSDFLPPVLPAGGLKWTRTTDLALIRRAL